MLVREELDRSRRSKTVWNQIDRMGFWLTASLNKIGIAPEHFARIDPPNSQSYAHEPIALGSRTSHGSLDWRLQKEVPWKTKRTKGNLTHKDPTGWSERRLAKSTRGLPWIANHFGFHPSRTGRWRLMDYWRGRKDHVVKRRFRLAEPKPLTCECAHEPNRPRVVFRAQLQSVRSCWWNRPTPGDLILAPWIMAGPKSRCTPQTILNQQPSRRTIDPRKGAASKSSGWLIASLVDFFELPAYSKRKVSDGKASTWPTMVTIPIAIRTIPYPVRLPGTSSA